MTDYGSKSPYHLTRTTDFYLGKYVDRPIPPNEDDILIEVVSRFENRPDLLSFELYNTSKYWWIFMKRNRDQILDPIYDLKAGMQIYVPTYDRIRNIIG